MILGQWNFLYDALRVDICHCTLVQTSRVNPKVSYGFWVIMMCECSFVNCSKYTSVVGDVGNQGGYACMDVENMWEVSVPFAQFCCEPKTTLKNKTIIKGSENG